MQRDNKFSAMDSAKGAVALRELTLGSLFDGIGGFCYAATLTGRIKPIWAAEIEPSCIDITRYRFPEVMHVGSVTELKGNEIQPVDIITFGSPCQDLSIAGARKGLKGNRSGLFLEAIRIIEESFNTTLVTVLSAKTRPFQNNHIPKPQKNQYLSKILPGAPDFFVS